MHWGPSQENYRRNVLDAAAWASAHELTLQVIFEAFQNAAAWPDLDALQRTLDRHDVEIDLERELGDMPPSLGGGRRNQPVFLSLRGLSYLADAKPLLHAFMRLVGRAVERYRSDEVSPKVTDSDLADLGLDAHLALLVSQVVFQEGWPFDGGSGEARGPWTRDVGRELRYVQGAETIEQYLEIQASLRYGPPPPQTSIPADHRALSQPTSPHPATRTPPSPSQTSPEHQAREPHADRRGSEAALAQEPVSGPPSRPFSRRSGARRPLSNDAFMRLAFKALAQADAEDLHVEAFQEGEDSGMREGHAVREPPRIPDPERWLMMSLGEAGLWTYLSEPARTASEGSFLSPWESDRELLLECLELWHRDVVSMPCFDDQGCEGRFSRAEGQARLRELLNEVLTRLDPPLVIQHSGQIVQDQPPGLMELTTQPLPDTKAADPARDRVSDAIRRFQERDATAEEQRLALAQLAGVLERLKGDGDLKHSLPSKDARRLFEIANSFGIRHLDAEQQTNYGPAFREWIFHAFLASIRLHYRVMEEGEPFRASPGVPDH